MKFINMMANFVIHILKNRIIIFFEIHQAIPMIIFDNLFSFGNVVTATLMLTAYFRNNVFHE